MPFPAIRSFPLARQRILRQRPLTRVHWVVSACLLLSLKLHAGDNAVMHIRLCTEEQPALPLSNPDPAQPGIAQQLIATTAKRMRAEISHIIVPWHQCQRMLGSAEVDAANVTGYAAINIAIAAFPMKGEQPDSQRSLGVISTYLYRRVGSTVNFANGQFNNLSSAVGVLRSYQVNSLAVAAAGGTVDDKSNTVESLARRLDAGRLDLVAADESLQHVINRHYVGKLERLATPLRAEHYYMVFSKPYYQQHSEKVEQFWTTLGQVRAEREKMQLPASH